MRFLPRQKVSKKIVDAQHPEVTAWRMNAENAGIFSGSTRKGCVGSKHRST